MNLDALLEPIPVRAAEPCKVGRILADLEEPYKSALAALLSTPVEDGGLSAEGIAERLSRAGKPAGATVIHRHRQHKCVCDR